MSNFECDVHGVAWMFGLQFKFKLASVISVLVRTGRQEPLFARNNDNN